MADAQPVIYLVRHGETEWSSSGKHTGRTDIPLTERGMKEAAHLASRLLPLQPDRVFASPLGRAQQTCTLAGFANHQLIDDLAEWDYGRYEGRTTAEIKSERPGWELFHDGCPGGESPEDVTARADRVVARLRALEGRTILFSHGHMIRALGARWCDLPLIAGRHLDLDTASVSALSYHHDQPTIALWNDHPEALRPPD
jgi:probable phosphoglycerate mutase